MCTHTYACIRGAIAVACSLEPFSTINFTEMSRRGSYTCMSLVTQPLKLLLFSGCGYGKPTYGEHIDIFVWVEADAADLLCSEICRRYPNLLVGRPSRLFDTVQRIVGPTRASLRGTAKLTGSPLVSYRRRVWEPRIRTTGNLKIF